MKLLNEKKIRIIVLEVVLLIISVAMIFPFVWMLSTSLKTDLEVFIYPPKIIPKKFIWQNYVQVWLDDAPMLTGMINSLKITVIVTIGTLISCSMAAFSFSKLKFPLRDKIFGLILTSMMIPAQVTLIPLYIIMARISWVDTHYPLIIPPILINGFGVFLLRQFIKLIPNELIEAAKIDGARIPQMYTRIVLPNISMPLVTLAIFTILTTWNSFLAPLIYLSDINKFTIPFAINYFTDSNVSPEWSLMMAAITTALVPMLLLYFFAQRFFLESVVSSGLKG